MKTFLVVWAGQLVSLLGSGLTGFALGLWVLQQTGSVADFALVSVCTVLPGVLFSPLAGALVDRWDRRLTMLVSECGACLATLLLAVLLQSGQLQTWHIYGAMCVISTLAAFQWPAYTAATTLMAPREHLANASGLVQLAHGLAKTGAPVLAGIMVSNVHIGLSGVLFLDTLSYVFAAATLLLVRFPAPPPRAQPASLAGDIVEGWAFLLARPAILGLMLLLAATNFMMGMIMVLTAPLVLSFANAAVLGTVMSVAGMGMFAGSAGISVWGGPKRRMPAVLGFLALSGIALLPAGLPPSAPLLAAGAFVFMLGVPVINSCSQAILQCKVPPLLQGRVFSATGMVVSSSLPLAFVLAGPLADRVFEPLLVKAVPCGLNLAAIVGGGPGRGVALMFVLCGLLLIAVALGGWLWRPLRRLESDLPDAEITARIIRFEPETNLSSPSLS